MSSFNMVTDLKGLNGALRKSLASVGGVKSPEMQAAARVLRRTMARVLSVSGGASVVGSGKRLRAVGGTPSAPGEPPRAQTKQLARSVKMGVVGTGIRVGPLRFTAAMLEAGVSSVLGARKTRKSGRGRGHGSGLVKRSLVIAPRPYLEKSVDLAKDDMATAFGDLAGLSITPSA